MIQIKEDFRRLIPPLSKEEYTQLEQNIVTDGCRDPLVVWRNGADWLIDGHNRLEICTAHGIDYRVEYVDFAGPEDVRKWIILNQFGRRNLSAYDRGVLALQLKPIISEQAKQNQIGALKQFDAVSPILVKRIDTQKELANVAGISHGNLAKVEKIHNTGSGAQKQDVKSGRKSINQVYQEIRKEEKKQAVMMATENAAVVPYLDRFIDIYTTNKKFNIIYADPPWHYWDGGNKNQSLHYQTMSLTEIMALPVSKIADNNSILFLWVTYPILQDAFRVIEAWGFKYSTAGFVWVKRNKNSDSYFFGNGSWTRANSELCLIATRGSVTRIDATISQIIDDRIAEHSEKPKKVRNLITSLVGEMPRIELFSRNADDDGWHNWGNAI